MDERVERGMRRQLAAAPADRIGWKIALNAPPIMEQLGIEEPALGWLAESAVAAGSCSLAGTTHPAVEPELVLEAGEGGALARIGVALEVVDFDRPLDDLEEVVAANVFQRAVAFGSLVEPVTPRAGVFSVNAEERASLSTFDAPAGTLAFVDGFLRRLDTSLAAGDVVIAGALAPPAPVSPGDEASVTVEEIGTVGLAFTP